MKIEHQFKFKDCCEPQTKTLKKLLRYDYEFYETTLDFIIKDYFALAKQEQGKKRIENSAVISFYLEAIDTFDGIATLHRAGCIHAAYPLLRKLFEVYIQLKFLLTEDTENKALAYEAYYESHKLKGDNNEKTIYHKFKKYEAYKKEADKAFAQDRKPKFGEWFKIYGLVENEKLKQETDIVKNEELKQEKNILKNFKDICRELGTPVENLYEDFYPLLSKNAHGLFARDFFEYDSAMNVNYIKNYRSPEGIIFQTIFCNLIMCSLYYVVGEHYLFKTDDKLIERQNQKIEKIKKAKEQYDRMKKSKLNLS